MWNLLGFILINLLYKKKKFDGQITLMYLGWYGLGRFFIELLRQDSLDITFGSQSLRISSVIGFLCFVVCTVLIIVFAVRPKSPALSMPSYYPGSKRYAEVTGQVTENENAEQSEQEQAEADGKEKPEGEAQNEENAPEKDQTGAENEENIQEHTAENDETADPEQ